MMQDPDAILSADWHLRENQPAAWTSSYWEAQDKTMRWLQTLSEDLGQPPVLLAGDIFDRWKPSPYLLSWAIDVIPENTYAIPGQHDLPQHRMEAYDKCGLNVLKMAGVVKAPHNKHGWTVELGSGGGAVYGFPWGSELKARSEEYASLKGIALAHVMTYRGRKPYPGCTAPGATKLMKQMPGFDLIVTGDNHEPFVVENEGQLLVNPGSLMRMTAAQIDYKPRVYLWNAERNEAEAVYIPQQEDAMSREHIDVVQERVRRQRNLFAQLPPEEGIPADDTYKRTGGTKGHRKVPRGRGR